LNWRTLIIVGAGVIEMFLLTLGGIKLLEFTDSAEFCGEICHTPMTPEFKAFTISPHSRVECATCHVGSGASYFVKSKVSGVPLVVATTFNTYPRPIPTPVENLRPARDTCQQCHWPEKFSEDRLKTYVHYSTDEKNTKDEFQLAFRVGSGASNTATDIHWHIASKLWYLPLDEKNQEIAWVGVENPDGTVTDFFDPQRLDQATKETIATDKRFMDCLDCHNRATHIFRSPDSLIDQAMTQGRIDSSLPFIKRLGVEALDVTNPSIPVTESKINAIDDFYRTQYPQVYASKKSAIEGAQATFSDLVQYVVFPEMRVTWKTHTNNVSHDGCFRCHGKLTTTPFNPDSGRIDIGCETCHYSISGGKVATPKIPHAVEGRTDCLSCHGLTGIIPVPSDHSGRTNDYCGKCHISGAVSATPPVPHVTQGLSNCVQCHGAGAFKAFPSSHAGRAGNTCTACHNSAANPKNLSGPSLPHSLEGRTNCVACHSTGGTATFPASHAGRSSETCALCHGQGKAAPVITHSIQGVTDCLQCHGTGAFKAFSTSHAGRGNSTCTVCHSPAATTKPISGSAVPHSVRDSGDCLVCHGKGAFKAFPASHAGRPSSSCTVCHGTSTTAVSLSGPSIPHSLQGRSDCLICHARGSLKPFPAGHAGRTSSTCQLCHKAGTA